MHILSAHHDLKSWGQTSEEKKILAIESGIEAPHLWNFNLYTFIDTNKTILWSKALWLSPHCQNMH